MAFHSYKIELYGKNDDGSYDFKKVITQLPNTEREKFIDAVKDSEPMMREWIEQRAILTNQKFPDLNNPEERDLIQAAWWEEVDKIDSRLPSSVKESGSVVKSVDATKKGSGNVESYKVIELESDQTFSPEQISSVIQETGKLISESNDLGFSKYDKEMLTKSQAALSKIKNAPDFDQSTARTVSLVNENKPDKTIPVTIKEVTGDLNSVTVDKDGRGFAIINKDISYSKGTTKDGGIATRGTVKKPVAVEISPNDIKMLEEKYNIKIMSSDKPNDADEEKKDDYGFDVEAFLKEQMK
jgi:hypothetical protein